jgi:MFS family permease
VLTSSIKERKNYGWTVVGVGIVIGCIGMGSMVSLSIFLQPMAEAMGWTRAGISTAALFNFLAMGVGSFLWGALSDRFGTRVVVMSGGALLGLGLVSASQAATLLQFQLLFGILVGLSVGALYTPLISGTMRWFSRNRSLAVALVSSGLSLGSTVVGPIARGLITAYDWRIAMLVVGNLAWLVIIPLALVLRDPGADTEGELAAAGADASPTLTVGEALRTPQFAAIALTHFACCAAHSGPIFHMASNAMDHGVSAMAAATVFSLAGIGSLIGRVICGLLADRIGAKRMLLIGLTLQATSISLYMVTDGLAGLLRARPHVRLLVRRGDAALRDRGSRVLRRADHGYDVRRGGADRHPRHGARATHRRLPVRHPRQLLLALHGLVRHRARRGGDRAHLPPAARRPGARARAERGRLSTGRRIGVAACTSSSWAAPFATGSAGSGEHRPHRSTSRRCRRMGDEVPVACPLMYSAALDAPAMKKWSALQHC